MYYLCCTGKVALIHWYSFFPGSQVFMDMHKARSPVRQLHKTKRHSDEFVLAKSYTRSLQSEMLHDYICCHKRDFSLYIDGYQCAVPLPAMCSVCISMIYTLNGRIVGIVYGICHVMNMHFWLLRHSHMIVLRSQYKNCKCMLMSNICRHHKACFS